MNKSFDPELKDDWGLPAIVDIAPSILQHLGIAVPPGVAAQMEGVSFRRRGSP